MVLNKLCTLETQIKGVKRRLSERQADTNKIYRVREKRGIKES